MKRENLQIKGSLILMKDFTNSECGDVSHFNWVTLVDVNPQHVKGDLSIFMNKLLDSICL